MNRRSKAYLTEKKFLIDLKKSKQIPFKQGTLTIDTENIDLCNFMEGFLPGKPRTGFIFFNEQGEKTIKLN